MDEVLEKMFEDTCTAIARDERELFIARIKRGQIYDHLKEHERALELWTHILEDVQARADLKREEVLLLKSSDASEAGYTSDSTSASQDEDGGCDVEEGRNLRKIKHLRTKRANELRDLQDLQHRATFMMANANFQLEKAEEETRLYDDAEKLRRQVKPNSTFSLYLDLTTPHPKSQSFY